MIKQWAKAIVEIYQDVVVPNWPNFITPITVNPSLATKYVDQQMTEIEIDKLSRELYVVDKWSKKDKDMSKWVF